jgi:GAF domain-containing protein
MLKRMRAVSVVSIATYDPDGAFLRSWALAHDSDLEPVTPPRGHMILSLMPYHRALAEKGETLCLEQRGNSPMTPAEARQVLVADPRAVLLVPVKNGDRTMGVISMAFDETRPRAVATAETVGAVLSLALQLDLARRTTSRRSGEGSDTDGNAVRDRAVRGYIRASLSGIMGSLQSLRTQPQPSAEALKEHLSIIDTSARRLSACFAEEGNGVD